MRLILILLVLIFNAFSGLSQNQIDYKIKGLVYDTLLNKPVVNAEIKLLTSSNQTKLTTSDSLGNYSISIKLESKKTKALLYVSAEKQMSRDVKLDFEEIKNVEITQNIGLAPADECWDSFSISEISFGFNSTSIENDTLDEIIKWIHKLIKMTSEEFSNSSLILKSYSSYNESPNIALERGMYALNLFLNEGFDSSKIELKIMDKEPLFFCQYCEGCHPYFLKGKGITLNKELIESTEELEIINQYNMLRQVVRLDWVDE